MKTIYWSRSMAALPHDVGDIEDYAFDWLDWLDGETISSHSVTGVGVDVVNSSVSGGDVLFRISGGQADTRATVDVSVVTSAGRSKSRSIPFEVRDF